MPIKAEIAGRRVEKKRASRLDRCVRRHHGRQCLVVDVDELGRVFRLLAHLGDDHCHRVTHMANLALGEQRMRWFDHAVLRGNEPAAGEATHLQIGAGEDRSNAGRRLGGSGVDGAQVCVSVGLRDRKAWSWPGRLMSSV
jgi:hypothetical protein